MDKQIREQYDKLDKLSNVIINNALIDSLNKRLETNKNNEQLLKLKANLLRKSGQLKATCAVYKQLGMVNKPVKLNSPNEKLTGGALNVLHFKSWQIDAGYSTVPLIIVDDFLTPDLINALYRYTLDNKDKFREANIDSNNPYYAPDKRATMVLDDLEQHKSLFVNFLYDNFDSFCKILEISSFKISKIEIKITNHVDGGFFRTHADNTALFGESGRVISWLYYFHRQPIQFDGGDLFAFDTDIENQSYKDGSFTKIEAKHNRFVLMPSCYYHTVSPTTLPSGNFDDGRMAVAGHIRFMEDGN